MCDLSEQTREHVRVKGSSQRQITQSVELDDDTHFHKHCCPTPIVSFLDKKYLVHTEPPTYPTDPLLDSVHDHKDAPDRTSLVSTHAEPDGSRIRVTPRHSRLPDRLKTVAFVTLALTWAAFAILR